MPTVKRSDWVRTKDSRLVGLVIRAARDGTWADVRWRAGNEEWSKRMPTWSLIPLHTIQIPGGTVTDMNREKELAEES